MRKHITTKTLVYTGKAIDWTAYAPESIAEQAQLAGEKIDQFDRMSNDVLDAIERLNEAAVSILPESNLEDFEIALEESDYGAMMSSAYYAEAYHALMGVIKRYLKG